MFATFRVCCHCAVSVLALMFSPFAFGQTVILRVDGPSGSATPAGQGNGWGSNAYKYLSDAIARAGVLLGGGSPPDTVQILVRGDSTTPIIYYTDENAANPAPTGTNNRTARFDLRDDVSILGGAIGTGGAPDTRDPATYITILSGDIDRDGTLDSDNSYHVVRAPAFLAPNINDQPHIDGFTIRGGKADGVGNQIGGGVYVEGSAEPYIRDCIITANASDNEGGGVGVLGGTATIRGCTISSNDSLRGGGVSGTSSTHIVLLDSTLADNTAVEGAGLFASRSPEVNMVNCIVIDNVASGDGGGVAVIGSGAVTVPLTITNSLIVGNSSGGDGAGIHVDADSYMVMTNCTLSGNAATGNGGGVAHSGDASTVQNSIFWSNTAASGASISASGSISVSYSDVQQSSGVFTGTGNINADPNFVGGGNYQLNCYSPCINAGNPTVSGVIPADEFNLDGDASTTEATPDLLLANRVQGNPLNPDMGAYEKPYTTVACAGEANADGCVGVADLLAVISTWGACGSPCPTDIMPQPCGNGQVNVQDLLTVIGNWGCGCTDGPPRIENVEDCMELCSGLYDWGSEDWCKCVEACAAQFEE